MANDTALPSDYQRANTFLNKLLSAIGGETWSLDSIRERLKGFKEVVRASLDAKLKNEYEREFTRIKMTELEAGIAHSSGDYDRARSLYLVLTGNDRILTPEEIAQFYSRAALSAFLLGMAKMGQGVHHLKDLSEGLGLLNESITHLAGAIAEQRN